MAEIVQIDSLDALAKMVGKEVAVSDWVEITQQRINNFAAATNDFQWIQYHRFPQRAMQSSSLGHGE